jgi:hypothetical protein
VQHNDARYCPYHYAITGRDLGASDHTNEAAVDHYTNNPP